MNTLYLKKFSQIALMMLLMLGSLKLSAQGPGNALNFDGIDDVVEVTSVPALNTLPVTLEAWVKPQMRSENTPGYPNNIVSTDSPGLYGLGMGININSFGSQVTVEYNDGFLDFYDNTILPDTWTHIAVVYSYGSVDTYINGILKDQHTFVQQENNATYLHIGWHNEDWFSYGTRRFFKGSIDEVRVWSTALGPAQIQSQYACELTGTENCLVAYYKFNQGIVLDDNQTVTTLYNAVAWAENGVLSDFALSGSGSNWVAPGGVVTGDNCTSSFFCTTTQADDLSACIGSTSVSLTATVSPDPGGGTVEFFVDGSSTGTVSLGTGGIATTTYNPSALASGTYSVEANFSGYGDYPASSSNPLNNGILTVFQPFTAGSFTGTGETICTGETPSVIGIVTEWHPVGNAGFTADGIWDYSFAVDGNGTPYLAFADYDNDEKATVMKFDGSAWVTVGTAGFSADEVDDLSLALDANGTLYVAFSDYANEGKATVMKFNGSDWVAVGTAGFSADEIYDPSLALYENTPYLAFTDYANDYKASVMKFDGSDWVPVGAEGFSADEVWDALSLAMDANGTPYVAYTDYANDDKATVMKFDGSVWGPVGAEGFSADEVWDLSLALDGNGTPYVAYTDYANDDKATVMKFDVSTNSWSPVGLAGFSANQVSYPTLALDGSGTPYVAFIDYANDYKATVMKFDGSAWVIVGPAGFSDGGLYSPIIALDGSGTPYVAYTDYYYDYKATVMKFVNGNAVDASGGDGNFTYEWRSSADNYANPITNANAATYTPPAGLTSTTTYKRYAHDGSCQLTFVQSTGTWTVTVLEVCCMNPTDGGTIAEDQGICAGDTPDPIIQTVAAGGSFVGTLQYKWQSSADGITFSDIDPPATTEGYSPPALTVSTWYKRLVKVGCETTWLESNVVMITMNPSVKIQLSQGWSAISSYLSPEEPNIVKIMQPVLSRFKVLQGTAGMYLPAPFNINTLQNWDVTKGYKVKMINEAELSLCGEPLENNTLTLGAGFHFIPVLTNVVSPIMEIFNNPATNILYISDLNTNKMYWPAGGINTLTELKPGKGYLANFINPVTLTFPDYDPLTLYNYKSSQEIYTKGPWPCTPNFNIHFVAIDSKAIADIDADYLGAFDADGNCVGYTTLDGTAGNFLLTVYGDDEYSGDKDGCAEGEEMIFKSFNSSSQVETLLTASFDPVFPQHDGSFVLNGQSKITAFMKSSEDMNHNTLAQHIQVYPNPAKDVVNITGLGPLQGIGTLMTAEGKVVKTFTIISPETKLKVEDLQPGVYLLKLETEKAVVIKRVVIQ